MTEGTEDEGYSLKSAAHQIVKMAPRKKTAP